jgi:YesN/AraC family two-component response regulator
MVSAQSQPSFSLLIVEDDNFALDLMARSVSLEFPHCTIYTANNGGYGIELFKQFTPDIVMTDIHMPVLDGIEMIRETRLINDKAKYIVLTAYSDREILQKIGEMVVFTYLMKPLDFRELFAVLEKCSTETNLQREQ